MDYTENTRLSEIVLSNIRAAGIFENYNINYSTDGKSTLCKACMESGIQTEKILTELNKLKNDKEGLFNLTDWKTDFLCEYIESSHHTYLRKKMPKILSLAKILSRENSANESLFRELQQLNSEFESHMNKEEKLLFPYIKNLVKINIEKGILESAPFGNASDIIKVMEKEHREANRSIEIIRKMCKNIKTEKKNDENKKSICRLMAEFEADLHIHIHTENNLLFPRTLALEKKLKKQKLK